MPLLTADYIYRPDQWCQNYALNIDELGNIVELRPLSSAESAIHYSGALCPGFVNVHCHLELSILAGKIEENTGMAGFIQRLMVARKTYTAEEQVTAIRQAMQQAWDSGTVAMGDISNSPLTAKAKVEQPLFTHTFIELLGLDGAKAAEIVQAAQEMAQAFDGLSYSLTAHAPYSMSSELIRLIYQPSQDLYSIHLLESSEERLLFESNAGPLVDFYRNFGIAFQAFKAKHPIEHITQGMQEKQAVIFVHNTEMTPEEIHQLVHDFPQTHFCLCPRANDFIHRTFPAIFRFLPYSDRICIGTDSLASNHSLDLFEELKAIKSRYPGISFHQLMQWATTNGAKALQQGANFGIFAAGRRPGVNLISEIEQKDGEPDINMSSRVLKLY